MAKLSIEERVKNVVVEQLRVNRDYVLPEARFREDLGADSWDEVELVMGMEKEFDGEIDDEEAEKLLTVGAVVKYVEEHTANKA